MIYLYIGVAALAALQHTLTGSAMNGYQWAAAIIGALVAGGTAGIAYLDQSNGKK